MTKRKGASWVLAASCIPVVTVLVFLWVDEFNLRWLLLGSELTHAVVTAAPQVAAAPQEAQEQREEQGSQQRQLLLQQQQQLQLQLQQLQQQLQGQQQQQQQGQQQEQPSASQSRPPAAASEKGLPGPPPPAKVPGSSKAPPQLRSSKHLAKVGTACKASSRPLTLPAPGVRKIGASIAVHPPKYHAAVQFLEQYTACPGAWQALSVFMVFKSQEDKELFDEVLTCLAPDVPLDSYVPAIAVLPHNGWRRPQGAMNQMIAAYKKWFGVAAMMDLGSEAPDYGLMVDSELLLYDNGGEKERGSDCDTDGPWSKLLMRIQSQEASRMFPAAKVSSTHTVYKFGPGFERSGKDYDRSLILENARFVIKDFDRCKSKECEEVRRQGEQALFSWWTDLPWVNLQVAGNLMKYVTASSPGSGGWSALTAKITWKRFEYIGYQQWCMMHEGFTIRDVTSITGEAKWGSYMEDPMPGARLAEISPMWVSGGALEMVENGQIPGMSQDLPPLLIFHADKGRARGKRDELKEKANKLVLELLKHHGRVDITKDDF